VKPQFITALLGAYSIPLSFSRIGSVFRSIVLSARFVVLGFDNRFTPLEYPILMGRGTSVLLHSKL
jgi:hypothetical protein